METEAPQELWMVIRIDERGQGIVEVDLLSRHTAETVAKLWGEKYKVPFITISYITEKERKFLLKQLNVVKDWKLRET